jgi:hypothetical protein
LIALTVKKTIDARLKMIVTIAMKFVSTLKRLKNGERLALCNCAMISPAAKRPANAIRPRKVTVAAYVKQRPLQKRHLHVL